MPVFTDVLKVLESDFNDRSYEDRGSGPPVLPNNKKLATIQLQHLNKKFKANKQYFDHYTAFMEKNYKEW
ncbi:hypothetical protein ROHU_019448 [Labeo rohita]|uniref:Uncharacterized protein n=1 Tax=Labeo rohita TaxID=84645 RepID=A0A498NBL7_LABRO|nr:hypothetical protein ROHU_023600 [Labeo rohita]RXN28246.1 hypothetical protein ROHU_019448 [Labeo rohita]